MVNVGERRHTSAGNVYELRRVEGEWRYVERVATFHGAKPARLWDEGIQYRWHSSQWEEQIPLVGERSDDPSFGIFIP